MQNFQSPMQNLSCNLEMYVCNVYIEMYVCNALMIRTSWYVGMYDSGSPGAQVQYVYKKSRQLAVG